MIRGIKYRLNQVQRRTAFALSGAGNYARLRVGKNEHRPQIAVVMVGRNDDYMSDFRERLYATIEWNVRYLVSEIVFVEWNPPAGRELLAHGLTKRFAGLRAYVVSPAIHQSTCENQNIKLLEYHAKNVGIRRAASPSILSTNADAAVGLDTVTTLLEADLDQDVAWTAERVDVPWREDQQQHVTLLGSLRYR